MPLVGHAGNVAIHGGIFADISIQETGIIHLSDKIRDHALHNSYKRRQSHFKHQSDNPKLEAILKRIFEWITTSENSILWLHGPAGAGTSVISQTVAELCEETKELAGTFFFSPEVSDCNRFWATLAFQFALSMPQLRSKIGQTVEDDPGILVQSVDIQLRKLIIDPFTSLATHVSDNSQSTGTSPFLVIVDSLDECKDDSERCNLLSSIVDIITSHRLPLRFMVASRPEDSILDAFNKPGVQNIYHRITFDQPVNSEPLDTTHPFLRIRKVVLSLLVAGIAGVVLLQLFRSFEWATTLLGQCKVIAFLEKSEPVRPIGADILPPTLVPPIPAIFYGREELVDRIVNDITIGQVSNGTAHPIIGPGGMGKSSVAQAVINDARILQLFGGARHWVPCDRYPTIDLFLQYLANATSIATSSSHPLPDIIIQLGLSAVPRIIVLDNFESLWDPSESMARSEEILEHLSAIPNLTLLVTMRGTVLPDKISWTSPVRITPLSLDAAKQTFMQLSPDYLDDSLDLLLEELECVALDVHIVARIGNSGIMPSQLLENWKKERTALLEIHGDRFNSADVSIRLSLNSRLMTSNPESLTLLSIIARLPGGIGAQNLFHVAPGVQGLEKAKRTLLCTSLAHSADGALQVYSRIRFYMLQYHPLDNSHVQALQQFYFQLVEASVRHSEPEGVASDEMAFALEESNARAVMEDALQQEFGIETIMAVIHYSEYLERNIAGTDLLEKAVILARNHSSPEIKAMVPLCLLRLGRLYIRTDDYERAITSLLESEKLYRTRNDLNGVGDCQSALGNVYRLLQWYRKAVHSYSRARASYESVGNRLGVSESLQGLALTRYEDDDVPGAVKALVEAEAICTSLADQACIMRCHANLGRVYRYNNPTAAVELLQEARDYYLANGTRRDVVLSLYDMGIAQYTQGDFDNAALALNESFQGAEALGNHAQMGYCLLRMGELELIRGRFEAALANIVRATDIFERIGNAQVLALSLQDHARIFAIMCRIAEADKWNEKALLAMKGHDGYTEYVDIVNEERESVIRSCRGSRWVFRRFLGVRGAGRFLVWLARYRWGNLEWPIYLCGWKSI